MVKKSVVTEQGDLNNPYSKSDWYKSHPFSNFPYSQGQNRHLPLLLSLGRTTLAVNVNFVIVRWTACFFSEHGKTKTCLQCHRSKWLSARLWDNVYRDHQYSPVDFRDVQNLTGQVSEQPDVTGPALSRCWTKQPPQVPPNLHDFTIGPRYIHFWVPSPVVSSVDLWMIPSRSDGHQPKGDPRRWFECSCCTCMRIFHAWGADTMSWIE